MYAEVLIEYKVKKLDRTFTYKVPEHLEDIIKKGMKVIVPFGNSDKTINGFVTGIKNEANLGNLKSIIDVCDVELSLNDELLKLGEYLRDTCLCTLISAYQTMLPSSLKIKTNNSNYQKYESYIVSLMPKAFLEDYLINECKRDSQKLILKDLIEKGEIKKRDYSKSSVDTLIKKGLIKEEKRSIYRIDNSNSAKEESLKLNEDQEKAYNEIVKSLNKSETFLLHGVTGSGKTEVYMHLIEKVVSSGKTAIMLVPEITLSMQIVNNFYNRFGEDVAILHSALSEGEKYDEYLKVLRGDAHIIVGTRSAVFAPTPNLGIIIIDEEQVESYKQDNSPRYNSIDVAKWRSKFNNIPLVLGSATPTYETYARALKGVYTLLTLPKRVGDAKLPTVKVVDMAEEMKKRHPIISEMLDEKIKERLDRKEQVILLLNRRGFSNYVTCNNCGFTYKCPNCDITLTYHKSSNSLRCHYCGHFVTKGEICPECKEGELKEFGTGTEKLEEELNKKYTGARIVRMDADTTSRKGSHDKIIKAFKNEEYDILLGTQMISKGLDFPKVTLVGVINADSSLNIPDFRSGERTYALLSQVSGRAGRNNLESEVIIQTFNPDNFTIMMAANGTYIKNYQYEMAIRKKLKYPPYYYLTGIKVCSNTYEEASKEANKVYNFLKSNLNNEDYILGPTTAGIFRLKNIYRFQIIIKYRFDDKLNDTLKKLDELYAENKDVYLEIDMNPYYI